MYYIIANPASRSGSNRRVLLKKLEDALSARGIPYEERLTGKKGDAEAIASEISSLGDHSTIVVIGGDGTINGVLNGIRKYAGVRFAFIPAGSANDLAKGLGLRDISGDPGQEETIRRIVEGKVRRTIDLGRVLYRRAGCQEPCERIFAVSAGVGFDAAVCQASEGSGTRSFFNRLRLGKLTYGTIALKELFSAPVAPCDVVLSDGGGESREFHIRRLVFATFMNTPFEGGGYRFAPDAVPDDGKINASMIGDLSKLTVLLHFPSAHRGTYYRVKGVYHSMAPQIQVRCGTPLWVHTDGEVLGQLSEFRVECIPSALSLVI